MVIGRGPVSGFGSSSSPAASAFEKGKRPPWRMTIRVIGSHPWQNSSSGIPSPACSRRITSWSPISTPWLMLLRAWMGAKEAAMAMRMPDHFSACTAVSRELPTPLRKPETMTSKLPSIRASRSNRRLPSTIRPA